MAENEEVKDVLSGLVEIVAGSEEVEPVADVKNAPEPSDEIVATKFRSKGSRKRVFQPQPREAERCSKRIKKNKRRVQFSGVKLYLFERTQGFSVVPSAGGSSLGMNDSHHSDMHLTIAQHRLLSQQESEQKSIDRHLALRSEVQRRRARSLSKFCDSQTHDNSEENSPDEEVPVVVDESDSDDSDDEDIKYAEFVMSEGEFDEDEVTIPDEECYFQSLGPGARKLIFKAAGVETDRSDKEDNEIIRASRATCGCSCEGKCEPETCQCAIDNIKCQIDRPGFPCTCAESSCSNPEGRVEFNEQRVRLHFQQTMMRLRAAKVKGTKDENYSSPMHIRFFDDSQTTTSYLSTPPPLIYQQKAGNEQNEDDNTPLRPPQKFPVTPTYVVHRSRLESQNRINSVMNCNNNNVPNAGADDAEEVDFPPTPSLLG